MPRTINGISPSKIRDDWQPGHGIVCPNCDSAKHEVRDSRPTDRGIRRRRHCTECGGRFITYETADFLEGIEGNSQVRAMVYRWSELITTISDKNTRTAILRIIKIAAGVDPNAADEIDDSMDK